MSDLYPLVHLILTFIFGYGVGRWHGVIKERDRLRKLVTKFEGRGRNGKGTSADL